MKRLITIYKMENPDDNNFRRPEVLYPFWEAIENKKSEDVQGDPANVRSDMDMYFQERCEIMLEMFYKKSGYPSEDPKVIAKFWTKGISVFGQCLLIQSEDKNKYNLNFESE